MHKWTSCLAIAVNAWLQIPGRPFLVVVTRNNFRRVGCELGNDWKYVFWSVWFEIRDQLVVNGWIRSLDEEIVNPGARCRSLIKAPISRVFPTGT